MNIKNLFKNLAKKVKELEYKLGLIADYVVEIGTSGIWTYEKWESGKAVCWGLDTRQHAITQSWGGVFYESNNAYFLTYPSNFFISAPYVFSTICNSSGTAWVGDYGSGNVGTSARTPSFAFFRGTASNDIRITLNVKAIGRWK